MNIEDYRDKIDAALRYSGGTHLFEDVVQSVSTGEMQLWANGDTVAITEIIVYPRRKMLNIFLAAGDGDELFEMFESAEQWAALHGCESITMTGRRGWLRVLNKLGFAPTLTMMEKTI